MEHVVFFSETTGEPAFRRLADLEQAVRLVETLRNERGVTEVSLHALTPVPVSFRTYYRVEVGSPAGPAPEREQESVEVARPVALEVADDESPEGIAVEASEVDSFPVEESSLGFIGVESDERVGVMLPDGLVQFGELEPDTADSADGAELVEVAEIGDATDIGDATEVAEPDVAAEVTADGLVEFDAFASPLVPQSRPELEPERSLGYFVS